MAHITEWLEKAAGTLTSADLSANGGLLSPQQAAQFIRVAIDSTVLAREGRIETSDSTKFEVPRLAFTGRILRRGVEAERVGTTAAYGDKEKPVTGLVTLSTNLFKGEVPVSDEFFEDNIERARAANTLMEMIAQRVGADIEEIGIKSDTARDPGGADPNDAETNLFDLTDGIIKQAQTDAPASQVVDMSAVTEYTELFAKMIEALPSRYRRDYNSLRFYVPVKHSDGYVAELAARGTSLGDASTVDRQNLRFRGIPVVEVPVMTGTSQVNGSNVNYDTFAILANPRNLIWGFHRRVRVERFRDPREGVTSFLPTVRFDVKWADPNALVLATGISL